MSVVARSYFVPLSSSQPFILEDVYFRGGLRVLPTTVERDAIPALSRKPGMMVITANDKKVWQLGDDKLAWTEFKPSNAIALNPIFPISILVNGDISIDPNYILPQTGNEGDYLVKTNSTVTGQSVAWQTLALNAKLGSRIIETYTTPAQIAQGDHFDFVVEMAPTVLLLRLEVDQPWMKIQAFSTPARTELNPYTFKSTNTLLADDGTTILSDGSIFHGRAYSILSNLEDVPNNNIYWRITNQAVAPLAPALKFIFVVAQ